VAIGSFLRRLVFNDNGKLVKSIHMETKNLLDGIPRPGNQSLGGHRHPLLHRRKTCLKKSQMSHRHRDEFLCRQSTSCCGISKSSEVSEEVDEVLLTISTLV
jgi:hypothetical protein